MNEEIEPNKPLTQQETEAWIGEVEDNAWGASAAVDACRFVLGNLLQELDGRGAINAPLFIARLQAAAKGNNTGGRRAQLGIEDLLNDLQLHFARPTGNQDEGNLGGTFH